VSASDGSDSSATFAVVASDILVAPERALRRGAMSAISAVTAIDTLAAPIVGRTSTFARR
jgi:hypothetical protein